MHEIKNYTTLDQHVIKALLYYEIFNYPLKGSEVFRFLGVNSVSEKDVTRSLDSLVEQKCLSKFGEFYTLQSNNATIARRLKGNKEAEKIMPLAYKRAGFISKFPFVRAVLASGSLSKDYMDEHSDLDFFIITAPCRLWICRTLLVLFKRVFLNNSHKYFCVNYFVDSDHLEIEEKNLFTATELATVIPLYGAEYYQKLLEKNDVWLHRYFPNFKPRETTGVLAFKNGMLKTAMEKIISLALGNFLEKVFMWLTHNRWKQLYEKKYAPDDFKVAFKTKKYASKNHPRHFQKKVMELYYEKLSSFNTRFDPDIK